jgi:hypothetical protein
MGARSTRAFSCLAATAGFTCLAVKRAPRNPPSWTPRRLAAARAAFVRSCAAGPLRDKVRLVCPPAVEQGSTLQDEVGNERPRIAQRAPSAGIDDLVIVPLAVIALAVSKLLKAVLSILIYVLDYAFPILLQLMRIPLLTARLIGDGMELLFEGVVRCLPVSSAKRDAWRARVRQQWFWFRRNISYQAFEHALHHAFEAGMAWVFRKCRRLTPSGALLVIALAVLWLPVSFGTATVLHATLIARAKSLPAWMQLLHPFATFIAKSKLLVLPVYPAAWPQAKEHPIVRRFFQFCRYCMSLKVIQKARYRYQQVERGAAMVANSMGRAAAHIGLADWFNAMRVPLTGTFTWIRKPWPDVMLRLLETFSGAPLVSSIADRYFARYGSVYSTRPSEQVRGLFERWSIKFSADYYEAKDREEDRNGPRVG